MDLGSGLVHTVVGTSIKAPAHTFLHGEEKMSFGDADYMGVDKRAARVQGFACGRWFVAARRGKVRAMAEGKLKDLTLASDKAKAEARPG